MTRWKAKTLAACAATSLAACAAVLGLPDPALEEPGGAVEGGGSTVDGAPVGDGGAAADTSSDAPVVPDAAACNVGGAWGNVVHLSTLATAESEESATLTADEQTIYFWRSRPPGVGPGLIMVAKRDDAGAAFSAATAVPLTLPANGAFSPCVTLDGAFLYYSAASGGRFDVVKASTMAPADSTVETGVSTGDFQSCGSLAKDGSMYIHRPVAGVTSFLRSALVGGQLLTAESVPGFVPPPTTLRSRPVISADELTIFYQVSGPSASYDIWTAHRSKTNNPFADHKPVAELASMDIDEPGWLSPDGCRLYFSSAGRSGGVGGGDLYVASRPR